MANPHIQLKRVEKRFDQETVLADIDLSIERGQFVALIGPSGCGKSTLLRLIAGLELPQEGEIIVDSTVSTASPHPGTSGMTLPSAFVFQDASLLPWRSAFANVALPLELAGIPVREHRQRIEAQLLRVGLRAADHFKLPRMLSGGMKMRVSLARALVTQPEILLMDEPFGALDDILRTQLNQELLELWAQHHWTTAFVTHQVSEAVFLSDRVLVMSHRPGRIHADVPIPLPRPRRPEMRGSTEFAHLVLQLQQQLAEVV